MSVNEPVQLPDNFAENLLNLEMEIEESENVPIETVTQLLQLYAEGIMYYESIKSKRYLTFKNKTQALLLKQNVNQAMKLDQFQKEQDQQKENERKQEQETKDQEEKEKYLYSPEKRCNHKLKQKQRELELNVNFINQQDNEQNIRNILQSYKYQRKQNLKIIEQQFKDQEQQLKNRLMKKKSGNTDKALQQNQDINNQYQQQQQQLQQQQYKSQNIGSKNQMDKENQDKNQQSKNNKNQNIMANNITMPGLANNNNKLAGKENSNFSNNQMLIY